MPQMSSLNWLFLMYYFFIIMYMYMYMLVVFISYMNMEKFYNYEEVIKLLNLKKFSFKW